MSAKINLEINDAISGKTQLVSLSMHEAKNLYLSLREMFGDYQTPNPELFTTIPEIKINLKDMKQNGL